LAAGTRRAARAYRPSLLCWVVAESTDALIKRMRLAALASDPSSRLFSVGNRAQALIVAEDSPEGPGGDRVHAAVHSVLAAVRAVRLELRFMLSSAIAQRPWSACRPR
jgi:hypothetical protein